MTLLQLKRETAQLPAAECEELAAHLKILRLTRAPAWKKEMARRMRAMDGGRKVTQGQFERMIGLQPKA